MKKVFNKEVIILIFLTIIFFVIQMVVPYIGVDDYYAHSNLSLIDNPFKRGIDRALNWNMRIGEIIFYTIGCAPKILYNFIISIFFACFLILMKKYSSNNYKNKLSQYILYYFLILAFMPILIDNCFKMSDACNHLIGTCFILTVLYPLIEFDKGKDLISNHKLRYNILIILGFFAGISSENNSIFILIFLVYILLKNFIKYRRITRWHIFTFISTLAGYMLLIFCKSTLYRISFFNSKLWVVSSSLTDIFKNFLTWNKNYIILFIILLVLYITINLIKFKRDFKFDKNLKYSLFLLAISITTVLMFIFSPYYHNRGLLLIQFILLINIINLINLIFCNVNQKILHVISVILLIISLISSYDIANYFYKYNVFDKNRDKNIEQQVSQKKLSIEFPTFKDKYKEYGYYGQELSICTEEIVKQKYNIDYEFKLSCN